MQRSATRSAALAAASLVLLASGPAATRGDTARSEWNLCKTAQGWKVAEGR